MGHGKVLQFQNTTETGAVDGKRLGFGPNLKSNRSIQNKYFILMEFFLRSIIQPFPVSVTAFVQVSIVRMYVQK